MNQVDLPVALVAMIYWNVTAYLSNWLFISCVLFAVMPTGTTDTGGRLGMGFFVSLSVQDLEKLLYRVLQNKGWANIYFLIHCNDYVLGQWIWIRDANSFLRNVMRQGRTRTLEYRPNEWPVVARNKYLDATVADWGEILASLLELSTWTDWRTSLTARMLQSPT